MVPALRSDHPNFWLVVVVVGDLMAMSLLGLSYCFAGNTSTNWRVIETVLPLEVFGVFWIACAASLVVGLWGQRPVWFRLGLSAGAAVGAMMALGQAAAVVDDLVHRGEAPAAGGPALYLFLATCLVAQSREPRSNPHASRSQ